MRETLVFGLKGGSRVMLASALRFVAYPVVMTSALALSWFASSAGWSPALAIGTSVGVAAVLTFCLERIIPYQRDWLKGHGDVRTDLGYALVSGPLVSALNGFLMGGVAAIGARVWARWDIELWPATWPTACRLVLALVIAELAGYWLHRFQHQNAFLWRFHAAHHSVHRLYFLNGLRQHPLDSLPTAALNMSLLILIGADMSVITLYGTYVTAHQFMQHSNVDVRLGPLNWIFSMAEVHRWHHSFRRYEMDANYGAALLVWDVVFGTRRVPANRRVEPPDVTGIADQPDYPPGFVGQLLSPFERRRWLIG